MEKFFSFRFKSGREQKYDVLESILRPLLSKYIDNKDKTLVKVLAHCVFWTTILLLTWWIGYANFPNIGLSEWIYHSLSFTFNYVIFYSCYYLRRKSIWLLLLFVLFVLPPLYAILNQFFFEISDTLVPESEYISHWKLSGEKYNMIELLAIPGAYFVGFSYNSTLLLTSFVLKRGFKAIEQNELNRRKKEENLNLELSFLRSQINPHFLFNTLNNIYGQALENKTASVVIISLSNLLRYSLSESKDELIPLKHEIKALKAYSKLLDSFFDQNNSIEIIGETKNEYCIRPYEVLKPLDSLLYFQKYENKFSNVKIEILETNVSLSCTLVSDNELESNEFDGLFQEIQEYLTHNTGVNHYFLSDNRMALKIN